MAGSITATELRRRYQAGGEIAIVDAREEGKFHDRHLLMASCLPLSRLEVMAPGLLPRRSAPIQGVPWSCSTTSAKALLGTWTPL